MRLRRLPLGHFAGVTEVMVNGADDVYVERKGRVERVTVVYRELLSHR